MRGPHLGACLASGQVFSLQRCRGNHRITIADPVFAFAPDIVHRLAGG